MRALPSGCSGFNTMDCTQMDRRCTSDSPVISMSLEARFDRDECTSRITPAASPAPSPAATPDSVTPDSDTPEIQHDDNSARIPRAMRKWEPGGPRTHLASRRKAVSSPRLHREPQQHPTGDRTHAWLDETWRLPSPPASAVETGKRVHSQHHTHAKSNTKRFRLGTLPCTCKLRHEWWRLMQSSETA